MSRTPPARTQRRERAWAGRIFTDREAPDPKLVDEAWVWVEREMIRAANFVNKRLLKPNTVASVLRRSARVCCGEKEGGGDGQEARKVDGEPPGHRC